MNLPAPAWYSRAVPLPDVERSGVVAFPPGEGAGFWAGAPSAAIAEGATYLAYRLRRPRGQGRGGPLVIARSEDGETFETVTEIGQKDLGGTPSIERPALVALQDGRWRLYVSYVDPTDARWRIDLLEGAAPEELNPEDRRKVLTAGDIGGEAVKDPVITWIGGVWHMWASYLPRPDGLVEDLHDTADAYTKGAARSMTGYATSLDGLDWYWHGAVLSGREGCWDAYCARITSILLDGPVPVAYYDGGSSVEENYEERTGLAFGSGLVTFSGAGTAPAATSPHASGSLRYVAVLPVAEGYRLYYEAARSDEAHELRTEMVSIET